MTPDEKHIKRINKYLLQINVIYDDLIREIALLAVKLKVSSKLFRFKDYERITKQVNEQFSGYQNKLLSSIIVATEYEWDQANVKVDDILKSQLEKIKGKIPSTVHVEKLREISTQSQNKKALEAFQQRKNGKFTVSERVWKIGSQAKENIEFAIDVALKEGMSAQELARSIKSNLNNPDALFRRVRDKHGNLALSKSAQTFNPGQGVYRSAHKNALRLASNEINTAYRTAEQIRIQANNDVVGVQIHLSPSHKIYDMCDELQGKYPKDFNWSSWHVGCKCFRTMIMKTESELITEIRNGQNLPPKSSENYVEEMPDNFNKWVGEYQGKKTPYFMNENKALLKYEYKGLSEKEIRNHVANNNITEKIFLQNGKYIGERADLHDKILAEYFNQEKVSADKVYMLGGAGANGKSSVTESGKLPHPKGGLIIDPDKVKAMIPEYQFMVNSGDKNLINAAANFVHEESSYLGKKIREKALTEDWGTIIDGVNDGSAKKIHENAQKARELSGKKVRADYVSLDTDLSLKLADIRSKKTGREVPKEVLLNANKAISKEFPDILKNKSFDELYLWDTNENGNPRLILTQINGVTKMYNKYLYERFLKKAEY